jgi:hypothetical protein
MNCFSQKAVVNDIKKIDRIVNSNNFKNKYTFLYNDSIKFKLPYITNGKSVGKLIVRNEKYSDCQLEYFIIEFSNKDSITNQLFRFYSLSESISPTPFRPYFYFGKYLFFMNWHSPYWADLDDRCKYVSLKIYDDVESYLKYNVR